MAAFLGRQAGSRGDVIAPDGMRPPMAKRDQLLLADAKGYDVTQSTMRDHVRLIDGEGNLIKNKNGGATFSHTEARRFLEALPDKTSGKL